MEGVTFRGCKDILCHDQYINVLCTQDRIKGGHCAMAPLFDSAK